MNGMLSMSPTVPPSYKHTNTGSDHQGGGGDYTILKLDTNDI